MGVSIITLLEDNADWIPYALMGNVPMKGWIRNMYVDLAGCGGLLRDSNGQWIQGYTQSLWWIGSGDNIRVMHDPWLRGSANRWVPSPQPAAEKILETPLVISVREDKMVWEEERNGCYSVKSGYKLAMRYLIGSDKYHVMGNWNGIWKAQAPHKAHHLLWRLCRGCLPTRSRLLERRVECTINCPVCDEEIEDELHQAAKEDLSRILGLKLVLGTGIYLGLPSMVDRSSKEIMIKSVLQAIPSYVMSMFILPASLIDDIETMINVFWWRNGSTNNNNTKGIHWLAWERLACPKAYGGLGFRNFEAFNKAMVAKQVWNIVQNPNSLVVKLIKARYFPRSSLFEAPLGYNPSFAWRSMWQARQILSLGCRWRIRSGDNIRVMHDPWLRRSANRWVPSPQPAGVYQLSVRDLLHDNYKAWNIVKVRNLFSRDVAEKILETPLVSSVREDKVVWDEERNGCYSVKSGYKLAMRYLIGSDKYHVMGSWNGIWKAQAPHKARHLLWRLCRGCLPTRSRLLERRVECTLNCPVCDEEIEDELHIFFRCAVARDSWSAAGLSSVLHNATYQQTNAMDRIFAICSNESSDTVGRVAMLLWCIWQNRNDKLWNDNVQMPHQIGRHAFDTWNDWTSMGLCFRDNSGHFMAGMTQ
ncbi:hypothetical protein TSUD_184530 [Trifolium subterraneum]|uniref:Reverse transcriptase zinc-binding domain-containing protein n=1 Tax=Trifolium subterraneum TaxID=3900 RepID=A0A2Z6PCH0_TRISU|nr:hypothetical protein TSUD_184530 [Trifolium subterraneum]